MSEKVGTCQYPRYKCKRKPLPNSKNHYCICHEQSDEKDIEKFNEEIEKIMQDKKAKSYNFEGFYFPETFDFEFFYAPLKDRIFKKVVYFTKAIFQEADFMNTTFQADSNFREAEFRFANFIDTRFNGTANFRSTSFGLGEFTDAKFEKDAYFSPYGLKRKTKFQLARFYRTVFEKRADFRNCEIEKKIEFSYAIIYDELLLLDLEGTPIFDFRNARFSDMTRIGAGTNLKYALFKDSKAELVDFAGAQFPKGNKIWEEKLLEKKYRGILEEREKDYCPESWEEVSTIYRKLKQAHQRYGDYGTAGEFYYREMECKKNALKEKRFSLDWFKSFGYSFLKHSCGYGEKPLRVMRNSLFCVRICFRIFLYKFNKFVRQLCIKKHPPERLFQHNYFHNARLW